MSAFACSSEVTLSPIGEVYARSLSTLERVGALAVAGALESANEGVVRLLRDDFETGVLENLRTAQGVEEYLDIERVRTYQIVDGQAVAADGTPMVQIIERGYRKALEAGERDERMMRQAHRDKGDLTIAERADALQPGQLLLTVSLPPLEGLASDPKFWSNLGYRPDLVYVQTYRKTEDGETMLAGSYSVGRCDLAAWRRVLGQFGITIPATASADDFIRSYRVFDAVSTEAQSVGQQMRAAYYREIGDSRRRQSVTEYLEARSEAVTRYFDQYLLPLAGAVHTGKNTAALQEFAQALLNTSVMSRFSPEVVREVMKVSNLRSFPRSAGPVMENLIRYALVERLREGLVAVVGGTDLKNVQLSGDNMPREFMYLQMARDVASGVAAGRRYGGCASLVLGSETMGESAGPQSAYGGRSGDNKESWTWKIGACRVRNCPSPNPTEVGPCSVCKRCQRIFDSGRDPAKIGAVSASKKDAKVKLGGLPLFGELQSKRSSSTGGHSGKQSFANLGGLLLAA